MKKRSNRVLAWMLALGLALGLTACGGSSNYSANGVDAPGAAYDASESNWLADDDYGYYEVADTTEAEESAVSVAPSGSAEVSAALDSSKVKMIYTAHLNVEVLDLNQAVSGLNQMVAEMGGYFQSSDRSGSYGSFDSLEVTHFADENDIGVFTECSTKSHREARNIGAYLSLVDHASLVSVHILDRVLNCDDVSRLMYINVVDHSCKSCRLT